MAGSAGKAERFEALVEPHVDALLRTAQRLTRDDGSAEDLVQDALLKGFRFFDRFEPETNFKAWIFKILMNAFVNTYRRRQRLGAQTDLDAAMEAVDEESIPATSDLADTYSGRQAAVFELVDDRVRQALLDLPEHLRIVFMLAVIEDLKYREIADILECPVGTVMSRLFRARAMLRQRLEQFADEAGYVAE